MSDEIDPQKALRSLATMAPQYAQARATVRYLDEYRKTVKALAMRDAELAGHRSAAAQEREAYASPQYTAHLEAIRTADEISETLRWKLVATEAAIEVWRSIESSNRMMDRGTK